MAHCINCNIIIPINQRYIYNSISMSLDLVSILEEWISHEVTDEDCVCQECMNLLLMELDNREEGNIGEQQLGHISVCISCGMSIGIRTGRRSYPLLESNPIRAYIMTNINPRQIPTAARACNACWQRAHRQTQSLNTTPRSIQDEHVESGSSPVTEPVKNKTTRNERTDKDEPSSSSSTADVTPPTAPPVDQNQWTQVVPGAKRKKTRQTDNTMGRSGGRPVLVSGRLAAADAEPQASGSHGQSGGEQPPPQGGCLLAETVASSQGGSAVVAGRTDASRGPSTVTREPQQSENISTQRRPHPVARRSNAYWRVRSSGGAGGGSARPAPSSSQPSQKRDRLDDSISPRGERKRRRTENTGSYARATQPHLSVAIAFTPRADMTQQEASSVQEQVENEIFAACLTPETPGTIPYAPAFEGNAFLSEGELKLWCYNDKALSWLQEVVPRLKSPRKGTGLTLMKQCEIPVRVRSALFVPGYKAEVGKLHRILVRQNPWYEVSTWTLYTYQRVDSKIPGVFLVLGIPQEQIKDILARGRKVAYSTGSIYIRFFTKEGVSDLPPSETPGSGVPTQAPTNTREPSVSTVLENIDAVLTEAPPTPLPGEWTEETGTYTTDNMTDTALQELNDSWAPMAEQEN